MDLCDKKILFVMRYELECGGSLIPAWKHYAARLTQEYGAKVGWVLPRQPEKEWLTDLQKTYPVFFIPDYPAWNIAGELGKVFAEFQPDLVHSHFELYDIAVARAVKRHAPKAKMVWHVHDRIGFDVKGTSLALLRYLRRRILYALRYHVYGQDAWFVPVSHEMAHFVNHFRKHLFTAPSDFDPERFREEPLDRTTPLLNGVPFSRLGNLPESRPERAPGCFRFLTFGGNFLFKGIATLLDAGALLARENGDFQILITRGNYIEETVREHLGGALPPWLKIIPQTERVGELFLNADCYVSAATMETMAFAIAEAEMFLLPVIQSDIPGTAWNREMPSVRLFPVNDAARLAEQMKKIMTETPEERQTKVLETRERVRELFDLDRWCDKLLEIYKGL